jgi:hypothetical protein
MAGPCPAGHPQLHEGATGLCKPHQSSASSLPGLQGDERGGEWNRPVRQASWTAFLHRSDMWCIFHAKEHNVAVAGFEAYDTVNDQMNCSRHQHSYTGCCTRHVTQGAAQGLLAQIAAQCTMAQPRHLAQCAAQAEHRQKVDTSRTEDQNFPLKSSCVVNNYKHTFRRKGWQPTPGQR